jgi:hypothetical protein
MVRGGELALREHDGQVAGSLQGAIEELGGG